MYPNTLITNGISLFYVYFGEMFGLTMESWINSDRLFPAWYPAKAVECLDFSALLGRDMIVDGDLMVCGWLSNRVNASWPQRDSESFLLRTLPMLD